MYKTARMLLAVLAFGMAVMWVSLSAAPAEQENVPAVSKAPENLIITDTAETPETLIASDVPEEPAALITADTSEEPAAPIAADTSEEAAVPIVPDAPAVPDTPIVPDAPVVPDTPIVPDAPAVPDTPIVPDAPAVPDTPIVPDAPAVPDTPIVPDAPAVPDTPIVPDAPVVPDTPIVPDAPAEPESPDIPDTPAVPDAPSIPDDPGDTAAPGSTVGGFLVDGSGMIYGVADPELAVSGGLMMFPSEGCCGIRAGAFADGLPSVLEIYIPANITEIEDGAFAGLENVEWYTAEPGSGFSDNMGMLVSENGTCLFAFPAGRTGICKVPAEITRIAENAFAGTHIVLLDMSECGAAAPAGLPDHIELIV